MSESTYDESISYNNDGAITSMARGGYAASGGNNNPATYAYYDNTHRVKSVAGLISAGSKNRRDSTNYVYDQNRNVIIDKALKNKIEYDYRNLPAKVTTYSDAAMTQVSSIMKYIYDADGNRVIKTQEK
jgi:hypothetical protein